MQCGLSKKSPHSHIFASNYSGWRKVQREISVWPITTISVRPKLHLGYIYYIHALVVCKIYSDCMPNSPLSMYFLWYYDNGPHSHCYHRAVIANSCHSCPHYCRKWFFFCFCCLRENGQLNTARVSQQEVRNYTAYCASTAITYWCYCDASILQKSIISIL